MYRFFVLVSFLVATLAAKHVSSQAPTKPNYFIQVCRPAFGNYTVNSTYHTNLDRVMFDLKRQAHSSQFGFTSRGESPDIVYGQYYCRGDIEVALCVKCVNEAADSVLKNCSNSKAAIIWYEECTLRYENKSMVGEQVEYPRAWWSSTHNVTDPNEFSDVVGGVMDGLIKNSTRSDGLVRFATGEGVVSSTNGSETMVYCLVQCSPDLNATQCNDCLRSAFNFMPACCGNSSRWLYVFFPVCQLRYNAVHPFYRLPPPPELQPPPQPESPSPSPLIFN